MTGQNGEHKPELRDAKTLNPGKKCAVNFRIRTSKEDKGTLPKPVRLPEPRKIAQKRDPDTSFREIRWGEMGISLH